MNEVFVKIWIVLKDIFTHKRMKSFYWRAGGMFTAEMVAVSTEVLGAHDVPQWIIVFVGLIFGEVTKYLNSKNP